MADDHLPPGGSHGPDDERVWDEYDWERFLQQQDRKTEKYMELLEKYYDDPNRDQIIAREMGWHHLLDENGKDWSEDLDALFSREMAELEENAAHSGDDDNPEHPAHEEDALESGNGHEQHPLYQSASALRLWMQTLFAGRETAAQSPAAIKLATNITLTSVKLAAALGDDDIDELGMTIAYLKRSLKAITTALEAAAQCETEELMDPEQIALLRQRIFHVRDGIILLMGQYRSEWRRRHQR